MALIVLAMAIFAFPSLYKGLSTDFPMAAKSILVIITVLYAATIPYFFVLWQSWKLLTLIDQNLGFSFFSITAFRNIKLASLIGGILLMGGFVPFLFPIADADDAPGLLIYGFLVACIPLVVSIFAAILEMLFQNALQMKNENDLTI
jgi:hypothetical protein